MTVNKTGAENVPFLLLALRVWSAAERCITQVREKYKLKPDEFAVLLVLARADVLAHSEEIRVRTGLSYEKILEIARRLKRMGIAEHGMRANEKSFDVWLNDNGSAIAGEVCRSAAIVDTVVADAVGAEHIGPLCRQLVDVVGYLGVDMVAPETANDGA